MSATEQAREIPRSGWIDPAGQVFGVDWAEHDRFAMRVLRRSLIRRYQVAAAERLRALGWVSYCHLRGFSAERELNNAQITAVFDICEQHHYELPVALPGMAGEMNLAGWILALGGLFIGSIAIGRMLRRLRRKS